MNPSELKILACIAVVPVIILLWYIFVRDKYHKEPLGLLVGAFSLGMISFLPILGVECVLGAEISEISDPIIYPILAGFVGAAMPEEGFKLYFLYILIWKHKEFDEHFDGIVYAVFVSLGFACVENLLYVFVAYGNGGIAAATSTGFNRAIFSIPGHFLFGVMMGYFFSLAKFERVVTNRYLGYAFWVPVFFHGTYDALLYMSEQKALSELSGLLFLAFIALNIYLWRRGITRIRHLAGLLVPDGPEASALKTCGKCGNVYESNLIRCPKCNSRKVKEKQKDDCFLDWLQSDRENDDCASAGRGSELPVDGFGPRD